MLQTAQFDGFIWGRSRSPRGARLALATTHGPARFWPDAGARPAPLDLITNRY
ncbi:MAG: hypothetical protein ACR2JY_20190 [Chloroflexota bacterium]